MSHWVFLNRGDGGGQGGRQGFREKLTAQGMLERKWPHGPFGTVRHHNKINMTISEDPLYVSM